MNPLPPCALAVALFLAAPALCSAASARLALPVMGTVLEVTVVADDEAAAQTLARAGLAEAREWDDLLTTWRPEGGLERLNGRAGQGAVPVDPRLAFALSRMRELADVTGGAFDPTVGDVVTALREGASPPVPPFSPPRKGIAQRMRLNGVMVELAAGTRLDAGGIGKGIALDAVGKRLEAGGARAFFLDFGGSSQFARGRPEGADGWKVAIAGQAPGTMHGFIELRDASLSTSRALPANDPAGAIVDPRSGSTIEPPRLVSVLAPDAASADAWSTALVVRGREALDDARKAGIAVLIDDANGLTVSSDFPLRSAAPEQTSRN